MDLRSVWCLCFWITSCLCLHITGERRVYRPGRHVCNQDKIVNVPVRKVEKYHRPGYQQIFGPCQHRRICSTYRLVHHVGYREVFRNEPRMRRVYSCCPGWSRDTDPRLGCTKPICEQRCKNNGVCVAPGVCRCGAGFSGSTCEQGSSASCSPECENDGVCVGTNTCRCPAGFVGSICDKTETGLCRLACQNGGFCAGQDRCVCQPGFTGQLCEMTLADLCRPHCQNGGSCISRNRCHCPSGFFGHQCERRDQESCNKVCHNGGSCVSPNRCRCPPGFRGQHCERRKTASCKYYCLNGGICIRASHTCRCRSGFTGARCELQKVCMPQCSNGGTCVMPGRCRCAAGFTGNTCETPPVDLCNRICQNGGICNGSNICQCQPGWTGSDCADDIDECATSSSTCDQDCQNTMGSYTCGCQEGFKLNTDTGKCALCLSCMKEFQQVLSDFSYLKNKVIQLETDKEDMQKNITDLMTNYHNEILLRTTTPKVTTTTQIPTTSQPDYADIQSDPMYGMLSSLSEQIGMLEERLEVCTCREYIDQKQFYP